MKFFPMSLIDKLASSDHPLSVDYHDFKTEASNYCVGVLRVERKKAAPYDSMWTLGFIARSLDFDLLFEETDGLFDTLYAMLAELTRTDIDETFYCYGVKFNEPEYSFTDNYHAFLIDVEFYVIDKRRRMNA